VTLVPRCKFCRSTTDGRKQRNRVSEAIGLDLDSDNSGGEICALGVDDGELGHGAGGSLGTDLGEVGARGRLSGAGFLDSPGVALQSTQDVGDVLEGVDDRRAI
jgi:hypothetical protein